MVHARLNGFLPSDFDSASAPLIDLADRRWSLPSPDCGPIDIADGRSSQEEMTEAERFAAEGFALLPHETGVRDWDADVESIYLQEIETIVRDRLFPNRRVEVQQRASIVRRGRDAPNPYAGGIHSDSPLSPEDYAANVAAFAGPQAERWWFGQFNRPEVRGFVQIDFWRVTNMREPLRHMPLALCRPGSVERPDMVPAKMRGIAPGGAESRLLLMRFNPAQQWVYFPEMTNSELLAFKLCEFWKDDRDARPQNVFHTAFEHPETPADAEHRQSCEHRVGVLILRDEPVTGITAH